MAKFCDSSGSHTDNPFVFRPFYSDVATQGADTNLAAWQNLWPQMGSDAGAYRYKAQQAANDPGWGQAAANARTDMSGANLNGTDAWKKIMGDWDNSQTGYTKAEVGGAYLNPQIAFGNPETNATMRGNFLNGLPAATDANRTTDATTARALDYLKSQAGNPNLVTQKTLNGDYLNSAPREEFNLDPAMAAMRRSNQAEAADSTANTRSQFARAGMGLSTANQQADQATRAAASARSSESESQARTQAQMESERQKVQSYLAERGIQANAAQGEDAAQRQMGEFGAGARINTGQFDTSNALARDNRERAAQVGNYMAERGFQNQAGQNLENQTAQNYLQERSLQSKAGQSEQGAARQKLAAETANYGQERAYQENAPGNLAASQSMPLGYLGNMDSGYTNALSQWANALKTAGGGQMLGQPSSQLTSEKGWYNDVLSGIGTLAGAAGGGI